MGSHSVTCHLTEVRIPPLPAAEAVTQFSDPGGMQGWVDLCYVKMDQPVIEPTTCKSQVQRPTTVWLQSVYNWYNCVLWLSSSRCSSIFTGSQSWRIFWQHRQHGHKWWLELVFYIIFLQLKSVSLQSFQFPSDLSYIGPGDAERCLMQMKMGCPV